MDADVRSQLLEEASEYLKAEEDDVVFNLAFDAACETVAAAVGKFDKNSARMKLALFLIMQQLYDNRSILETKNNEKISCIARTILLQLQLEYFSEDVVY